MKNNLIKRPLFYIWLLLAALLCFMYYCLIRLGVMPVRMLILLVVIGALMLLILGLLWLKKGSGIFSKIFGWILAVVLALTAGTGSYVEIRPVMITLFMSSWPSPREQEATICG